MTNKDIIPLTKFLGKQLSKFRMNVVFNQEEVKHWFIPRKEVIYTYVKKSENGEITDLISFYNLPSLCL